jgi:predicted dinucleotide-binding enzyme
MKIGIIGSGHVGQTLAKGLAAEGHSVRIGSRTGDKLAEFSQQSGVAEGTFEDVAAESEVVIVALKGDVAEAVVRSLAGALAGKVVLDTTNPIGADAPKDGIVQYFTAANESLLERLQAAAPAAKLVKFFNSVGAGLMVHPSVRGGTPSMFVCGNDADAKAVAGDLAKQLGWNVEDVGSAAAGHAIEALCQLWCAPGFQRNDWTHAFAVLRP